MTYRPRRLREKPTPRFTPRYIIETPQRLTMEEADRLRHELEHAIDRPSHIIVDNGARIRRWR